MDSPHPEAYRLIVYPGLFHGFEEIGLLSLWLSISQGVSSASLRLAPETRMPHETVTLWEGLLCLTSGSETDEVFFAKDKAYDRIGSWTSILSTYLHHFWSTDMETSRDFQARQHSRQCWVETQPGGPRSPEFWSLKLPDRQGLPYPCLVNLYGIALRKRCELTMLIFARSGCKCPDAVMSSLMGAYYTGNYWLILENHQLWVIELLNYSIPAILP